MSRLFRSPSVTSNSSRSSLNRIPNIINEEQFEYHSNNNIEMNDWNIPRVPSKEIYKKKWSLTAFNIRHNVLFILEIVLESLSDELDESSLL